MSQTSDLLAERYGKQNRSPKVWIIAGITVIAVIFFSFAIYANFVAKPVASAELSSYETVDATHIRGNFTALTFDQPASCIFKAYNAGGAIVGYSEVEIPANNSDAKPLGILVKTVVEATVLKVEGCSVK